MNNNCRFIVLSLLLCFFIVSSANATALNFDDLVGNTNIKDTYYNGVFFTSPNANTVAVFVGNAFGAGSSSLHNSISADTGTVGMGTVKVIFPVLANYVKITGGDAGGDQDSFRLEIYDSTDNLLASAATGIFGGNAIRSDGYYGDVASLQLNGNNIAYALLIPTSTSGAGLTFDDLTYNPVPIPGAVWLLGSGLLGLVGWRRSRKG
jgi:hypothetical protein